MKVLVVDDSKVMRMIIGKCLKELGHEIREAGDGEEALKVLRSETDWGLFTVDWNMPKMNGYEFIVAARAEAAYKTVPIVMVTTETEIGNVQKAMDAGANEFIMKPFGKDAIQQKLVQLGLMSAAAPAAASAPAPASAPAATPPSNAPPPTPTTASAAKPDNSSAPANGTSVPRPNGEQTRPA